MLKKKECPYCKSLMDADWVDVDVGFVQCGPYHCYDCGASEIGPEFDDWCYKDRKGNTIYLESKRKYFSWLNKGKGGKCRFTDYSKAVLRYDAPFSKEELQCGFYKSGIISPYANTVNGKLVDHESALSAYKLGFLDEKQI